MAPRKTNGKYVCSGCGEHFASKTSKDAHERREHQLGDKLRCSAPGCGESFADVTGFNRHKRNMHMGKPKSQCPRCKKPFRRDNLKRHMKSCKAAVESDAVLAEHEYENENELQHEHLQQQQQQQLPLPVLVPVQEQLQVKEQMAVEMPPAAPLGPGSEWINTGYMPVHMVGLQTAYLPTPDMTPVELEFQEMGRKLEAWLYQDGSPTSSGYSYSQFVEEGSEMTYN